MIVITGAMLASAAIAGGTSAAKGFFDFQRNKGLEAQARRQTSQRNRLRMQDFMQRQDAFNRRKAALEKKRELDYEVAQRKYEENAKAVQRSTEAGLTKLSDLSDDLIVKSAGRNRRLAEVSGIRQATGQTGKSVRRLEGLQGAAAGRSAAADNATQERAIGSYIFNQTYVRDQAEAANKNVYDNLRYQNYDPGPAPFYEGNEQMPKSFAGQQFIGSLIGAVGDAAFAGLGRAPKAAGGGGGSGIIPTPNRSSLTSLNGFGLANTNFSLPPGLESGSYSTMFNNNSPFGPANFNRF